MPELICPHCDRLCKTSAGLTRHINDIHMEMTPAQLARWDEALAKSRARRSPSRAALEALVGKEIL